uniref:Uncharacterized protein n=1 Tax=Oryza rufipogon TaxID=4529 RepID=A0A0E0Q0P2_ORYRU
MVIKFHHPRPVNHNGATFLQSRSPRGEFIPVVTADDVAADGVLASGDGGRWWLPAARRQPQALRGATPALSAVLSAASRRRDGTTPVPVPRKRRRRRARFEQWCSWWLGSGSARRCAWWLAEWRTGDARRCSAATESRRTGGETGSEDLDYGV